MLVLYDYHYGEGIQREAQTQAQFAELIGVSESTATRRMETVFGKNPFEKYFKLLRTSKLKGELSKSRDGSLAVDGITEDRETTQKSSKFALTESEGFIAITRNPFSRLNLRSISD
jgi:hypothetical protein